MGEARRARLWERSYEALPLWLKQPPLPLLVCGCRRPGWYFEDVDEALAHTLCPRDRPCDSLLCGHA